MKGDWNKCCVAFKCKNRIFFFMHDERRTVYCIMYIVEGFFFLKVWLYTLPLSNTILQSVMHPLCYGVIYKYCRYHLHFEHKLVYVTSISNIWLKHYLNIVQVSSWYGDSTGKSKILSLCNVCRLRCYVQLNYSHRR